MLVKNLPATLEKTRGISDDSRAAILASGSIVVQRNHDFVFFTADGKRVPLNEVTKEDMRLLMSSTTSADFNKK